MPTSTARLFASLSLCLTLAGCPPQPETCAPGDVTPCSCDGGAGTSACADGVFGACVCVTDAGTDAPLSDAPVLLDAPLTVDAPSDAAAPPACVRDVDWLVQIDTSNSMIEEQARLAAEIPAMIRGLLTGDIDGDGTAELMPVRSLHFGVITPDLGTDAVVAPTCGEAGQDGILRDSAAGCTTTFPGRVFSFEAGDDVDAFAADASCVTTLGNGGCGFEQQLEAVLKSLSPASPTAFVSSAYAAPTFRTGAGHGDGANAGFLREGSLLAITILSDEDDCSATDYRLFSLTDPAYAGTALNLRCGLHDAALHPLSRYVDGLLQLRTDPRHLVFNVITGLPVELGGESDAAYAAMLADPRMANVPLSDMERLTPACTSPSGNAAPGRRFVGAARALSAAGAYTRIGSICADAYTDQLSTLYRALEASAPSCE